MKKGCDKCDYTGFAYGNIPCMCVENSNTKLKDPFNNQPTQNPDFWDKVIKINGVPLKPDIDKADDPYDLNIKIGDFIYMNDDGSVTTKRQLDGRASVGRYWKQSSSKERIHVATLDGLILELKFNNNYANVPALKSGDIIYYKDKLLGTFHVYESHNCILVNVALFSSYGQKELEYKPVRISVADITKIIPCDKKWRHEMGMEVN